MSQLASDTLKETLPKIVNYLIKQIHYIPKNL